MRAICGLASITYAAVGLYLIGRDLGLWGLPLEAGHNHISLYMGIALVAFVVAFGGKR